MTLPVIASALADTLSAEARVSRPPLQSYAELCAEAYDLDKPEPPKYELAFYWQLFERSGGVAGGGPVLELMCGTGRFLVPFAERGADIDGVDASPQMLAACRAKLEGRGLSAGVYEQFTQDLDLPRRYGYAFLPGGSFTLLDRLDARETLRRVRDHLLPGAILTLDCLVPRRITSPEASTISSTGSPLTHTGCPGSARS